MVVRKQRKIALTWRSNRQGSLEAAYLGLCRVGYAQRSAHDWIWNTTLLRPEGTAWYGRASSQEEAHEKMTAAVTDWVAAAGLGATSAAPAGAD